MAARAKERQQKLEEPATYDRNRWRRANCVFGPGGEILYPGGWMPCPSCGQEQPPQGWGPEVDHPFERDVAAQERDEICTCGLHESHHRPHDCRLDAHEPIPCACAGGQPWSCCWNLRARQEQYVLQKFANVLRAAVEAP